MNGSMVIAVDGGNSKTDVAVLRDDGTVLALVRGPGSSPHHLGLSKAVQLVDDLVDRAWLEAGVAPEQRKAAAAAVFMAGADLPHEEQALGEALTALRWADRTVVANDVDALLWAATGNGYGVAVTVGAGVNCRGRGPDGRVAWFPALGGITGDWGGGPDIGIAALGAGVRAEDRRGAPTTLSRAVPAHFQLATSLEVAIAIHQQRIAQERLVELPPLVLQEALAGDAQALLILHRQADEVVDLVRAALVQMGRGRDDCEVVLGGSILAAIAPVVLDRIVSGVADAAPRAHVTVCLHRPVLGAGLAALHLAGSGADAAARLRASWSLDGEAPGQ